MLEWEESMSKAPYPRLEHLNFRLDVLSALAKGVASDLYEAECGVTLRDLRVLRFVDMQPGISLGPLIVLTYLEKTLVSKLVTALAKRGLLVRSTGTEDARVINLHLTRKGKAIVSKCDKIGKRFDEQLMSVLSLEEKQMLFHCIAKLTEHVEEGGEWTQPQTSRKHTA
ncbi:MarR family winged helix-turn-helix transcriptional regulator [Cupriavidus sp. CuC1]|uniref:MarR family winged helix-turn-helix transcriptional regulator n=1 Tax=Cupriavidus sp. CuC1 TaxID=3373131 RepID=UPI0037D69CF9